MTKFTLCGALIAAVPVFAQDPVVQMKMDVEKKLAEAKSVGFISGQMISGRTIKGSPYTATAVTETTQTLADGNRISRRTSSMLYRDTEGRERREESIGNPGSGEQAKAVFISDPVEGVSYTLEPGHKIARKNMQNLKIMTRNGDVGIAAAAPVRTGDFVKSEQMTVTYSAAGTGGETNAFFFSSTGSEKQKVKTEDLGTQNMEGVSAQGTRTTVTIPAGEIGNEQPINIVSERWVSPELGVAVMTSHSDPRSGKTTYKLTNINRSDPARSLFEVPADYTVRGGGEDFRVLRDKLDEFHNLEEQQ